MATEHAKLPLWKDKNDTEKQQALSQLFNDANVYAQKSRKELGEARLDNKSQDAVLSYILNLYRYVLFEDTATITNYLRSHKPADSKEEKDIQMMLKLIEANPNIFNMNCETGHLTGSALVVDTNSGSVLLHLHKKLNKWLQFGGHPEYETDFSEVALREALEETGLPDLTILSSGKDASRPVDIDLHVIPEGKGKPEHWHLDLRYVLGTRSPESVSVDSSQESNNFVWFKFDEVGSMGDKVDAPLARLIEKARKIYVSKK